MPLSELCAARGIGLRHQTHQWHEFKANLFVLLARHDFPVTAIRHRDFYERVHEFSIICFVDVRRYESRSKVQSKLSGGPTFYQIGLTYLFNNVFIESRRLLFVFAVQSPEDL